MDEEEEAAGDGGGRGKPRGRREPWGQQRPRRGEREGGPPPASTPPAAARPPDAAASSRPPPDPALVAVANAGLTPSRAFLRRAEAAAAAGDVAALSRLSRDASSGDGGGVLHPTHARALAAALVRAVRRRAALQQLPDGAQQRPVWRRAWWDDRGDAARPIAALEAGSHGGSEAAGEGAPAGDAGGGDDADSGGAFGQLEMLQRFQHFLVRSALAAAEEEQEAAGSAADPSGSGVCVGPAAVALAAIAGCAADMGWRKPPWVPSDRRGDLREPKERFEI